MENDNSKTVKRTEVEVERDQITVRTDLDVPKNYPELPIFAGEGWVRGELIKEGVDFDSQYRFEESETGAVLRFTPNWERSDCLMAAHAYAANDAQHTFECEDFLVDYKHADSPYIRVRLHPQLTDPEPKVVVERLGDEEADQ